jgi:prepilin-type N-terminal cleavage/methylation domain-containing protein
MFLPLSLHSRRGFTLVELLVVIAIIAILAALAFPVLGRMRTSASAAKVTSNLHQVGVALTSYASDNGMRLPASGTTSGDNPVGYGLQPSTHTWVRLLSPNHKGTGAYNDPGTRLGAHLAPYVGVTGAPNTEKPIEILSDPAWEAEVKRNGGPTGIYWSAPTFVLRPVIRRAANPGLSEDLYPFGKDGQSTTALRLASSYAAVTSLIPPGRTWALIQADRELIKDSKGEISSGMVHEKAPTKPVLGNARLALMFDWSVQRIPVGTDLGKSYPAAN